MRARVVALILSLVAIAPGPGRAIIPTFECDWPMYGHDASHSFAQPPTCAPSTLAGVPALVPRWIVPARDSVTASPAVVDGILYVGAWDGTFYAIDAATGDVLWTFQIDDDHDVAFGRIVSSAAVDQMIVPGVGPVDVVLFGGGATLYALKPGATGPVVLAKIDVDPRTPELREEQADNPPEVEIESSPVVGHFANGDRVYVGMDVHNGAGVGRTGLLSFGLRANPGGETPYAFELLFKFDPETSTVRTSLTDGSGTGFGCGGVWSSPALAYDGVARTGGTLVFGTSNCEHPEESAAAGEVAREAVFAIDAITGAQRWRFAPRGPNIVDDDFGASPNILPDGSAGVGGKDGTYYVFDLAIGRVIHAVHAGQSGHVSTQFAVGGMIGSAAVGNPQGRTLVFATTALSTPVGPPLDSGEFPLDPTLAEDPLRMLSLHAIDWVSGEMLWRSPLSGPSYGAPSYAGGIVFVPVTFGLRLAAFEAGTGLPLWTLPVPGAPSSTPVVTGDSIYMGVGTRETDLEYKAFGDELGDALTENLGAHPLSPLSAIVAFSAVAAKAT